MLNLFKPQLKDKQEYRRWTVIYASTSAVFSFPVLWLNWHIALLGLAMLPFMAVSIYYTKTKNERVIVNDLAGISIFALAGIWQSITSQLIALTLLFGKLHFTQHSFLSV